MTWCNSMADSIVWMKEGFMNNEQYMKRAIQLALQAEGKTSPNPLVGAVIVKDNKIIGEGFHRQYGQLHAEREAIKDCYSKGNNPQNATIYVTLEPCCHFGKQPPCTHAIVEAGISKVVIGSADPNPLVAGKGIKFLQENNIQVEENFLKDECAAINKIFFHYITTKTPYVAIKYAMTMDGKIATKTGKSKWITSEQARNHVHTLRNKYSAILVGINTVLQDNPMLNCRIPNGKNPIRIICDSSLKIPLDSNIVQTAKEIPTIVATCQNPSAEQDASKKIKQLSDFGVETIVLPCKDKVNLNLLMKILSDKKIDSILIEGGSEIHYSVLESKIANHIYCYIAPKLFGGRNAKSPIGGQGIDSPENCFELTNTSINQIGSDFLIEADIKNTI